MKSIDLEHIRRDPIEQTELFQAVELTANIKAYNRVITFIDRWAELGLETQMEQVIDTMYGYDRFCFEKKKILWEYYGIVWKSPVDLNPEIDFDHLEFEEEEEAGIERIHYEEK